MQERMPPEVRVAEMSPVVENGAPKKESLSDPRPQEIHTFGNGRLG